jgi:hypothetical protein
MTVERGENWGAYVERADVTVVVEGKRSEPIPVQYKHAGRRTFELSPGENGNPL